MTWLMCLGCLLFFLLQGQVHCSSSFSSNSSSTKLCPHDQSFALLQLKNSFFSFNSSPDSPCDESYPKMNRWDDNVDCCSWDGVTCDKVTGHVIGLDLSCSWLRGTIHSNSSLFLLPHLQRLNLAFNDFNYSQISSEFGRFTSLTHLNLSSSVFSGHIPSEISHLSKLVSLDLSYCTPDLGSPNFFRNFLRNFLRLNTSNLKNLVQNLTKLKQLNLGGVNMSSVEVIGSLTNLSSSLIGLRLKDCGLTGEFPSNIFRLPNLQTLDLSQNYNLTVYFPKANWRSGLKFLDLSNINFLQEVPHSINNLQSLNYLGLSSCNFSGSIPAFLGNLTQVTHLDLSMNNFSGPISTWLGNLTQMNLLSLAENNFSGQILSTLSKLDQLYSLDLTNNHFTGSIPARFDNLTQLRYLLLGSNNFSGQIPPSLFSGYFPSPGVEHLPWKNLILLDLHSNMLQGPLPIPPLTTIAFIISNNRFTGEIPSLICNVSSLEILNLSNNSLSGIIPQCLGNLVKNLSVLDLRMNSFHGTIPKTFVKGNALRSLYFNGNKLEGLVPQSLVNCTKLEVLDLGNNKINDTFPYWLETLPELHVLVLRSNRFHGPIKDSNTKHSFPKLRIFDLSGNDFNGPLPTRYIANLIAMMNAFEDKMEPKYIGQDYYQDAVTVTIKGVVLQMDRILTIFTTIDLSNNNFQGEILKSIGNLSSLRLLNFSHNNLTGHIPSSLEHLRNLESLDLSSNNLVGEIPRELTSLNFLSVLNLSQNHLEGPIPQGPQFNTFENNSYRGNLGLCGHPLSKKCNDEETPQPPPFILPKEDDPGFAGGFEWKAVAMGYGSGTILGLVMGYLIFLIGKPEWLVRIVEGKRYTVSRLKKNANTRGGRSN